MNFSAELIYSILGQTTTSVDPVIFVNTISMYALPLSFWFLALGSIFGSFLNVVVYRLPLGKSLSHPPSHCPLCSQPIRWYDNIPVLSWIILRGRCRSCAAPISIRYPLVEAWCALLFLAIFLIEMPGQTFELRSRFIEGLWFAPTYADGLLTAMWRSTPTAGYLFALLVTLTAATLICFDKERIPARLYFATLAVGFLLPICFPGLDFRALPVWEKLHTSLAGPVDVGTTLGATYAALDGIGGAVVGLLVGGLMASLEPRTRRDGIALAMIATGLTLGFQAAIVIGALSQTARGINLALSARRRSIYQVPTVAWILLLAILWIAVT